jgi:DNA-binding transcriptional MocR family regulator
MTTPQAPALPRPASPASTTCDPRPYIRIATDLRARLHAATITAGTTLDIGHLARQWGVSRTTARKALRTLENDGLIRRYPGHGYRALPPPASEGSPADTTPAPPAADPAQAATPAAPLKPIMDRIDTKLAEILQDIAALKEIAGVAQAARQPARAHRRN